MLASLSSRSTTSASDRQTEFQREVATRFGLVPNFFSSAPDAPEIIERLWEFAKAGYLDNPIPSLFKTPVRLPLAVLRGSLLHCTPLCVPGGARSFVRGPVCRRPKH